MITDVEGVLVGHWTNAAAGTGCTAVLLPPGSTGAYVLAGAAPGTRETDLLGPANLVSEVHAFLLTGGSAFGLAAADGVVAFLEERGVGFAFGNARVPIVPAAVIFDLGIGDAHVRPGPDAGRAACAAAQASVDEGSVGAGTGATVAKWAGREGMVKGGVGTASRRGAGGLVVGALVVCNAAGDVLDDTGAVLAGTRSAASDEWRLGPGEATVIGVVACNARFDKARATHVARMAAAGIARSVRPAHTLFDGDVVFAAATNKVDADTTRAGAMAADAVAEAIRRAVRAARGLHGVPGLADAR